ncbi:methionine aminopeptidase [Salmonella enterica subsp. salamae]|uniref:Methionine aminopeptidase n=1 Tax=Salmonella enterica subsp. salamae TaxID=59202 RepID=A0A6D2GCJ6_SALER|nr:methionine aminopeptidase [Salmonella enterica subsp. salamae]
MAISIKTPEEIEKMRVAGRLAAEVLEMIEPYIKPGVTTGELDRICNDYIVNEQHAISRLPRLPRLSEIRLYLY